MIYLCFNWDKCHCLKFRLHRMKANCQCDGNANNIVSLKSEFAINASIMVYPNPENCHNN